MTLQEEINNIVQAPNLSYDEKAKKLAKLVTSKEISTLLPKQMDLPKLKEKLQPKTKGMKILHLSIHGVYLNAIEKGVKPIEYRDYNDYYKQRCTYTENGKTYLVPYDAITFYQGKQRSMTVQLKDITCDGSYFMFHLGKILYK